MKKLFDRFYMKLYFSLSEISLKFFYYQNSNSKSYVHNYEHC